MSLTASSPNASSPITLLFVWMAALFVTALLVANTIGGILVPLPLPWGQAVVTAGIFIFPITFVLTDLLNEFFGEAGAKRVTWLGFAMGLVTFVGYKVAVLVPALRQSPLPAHWYDLPVSGCSDGGKTSCTVNPLAEAQRNSRIIVPVRGSAICIVGMVPQPIGSA